MSSKKNSKNNCVCKACGKEFHVITAKVKTGRGIYCSRQCRDTDRRTRIKVVCQICLKEFYVVPSQKKNGYGIFCSKECYFHLTPEERFEKYVSRNDQNDCWTWTGTLLSTGYGQIIVGNKKIAAHRFAYKLIYGDIPKDMFVCHRCDNRKCVNVSHLFLADHNGNMSDMVKKGRSVKGEKNKAAKLTKNQVMEIRNKHKTNMITQSELADQYGVTLSTINKIVLRRTWKHI